MNLKMPEDAGLNIFKIYVTQKQTWEEKEKKPQTL